MSSTVTGQRPGEDASSATTAGRLSERGPEAESFGLLPRIGWDQLEAVMAAMAASSDRELMVRHLLQGVRLEADGRSAEESFREILFIAALLGVGGEAASGDRGSPRC